MAFGIAVVPQVLFEIVLHFDGVFQDLFYNLFTTSILLITHFVKIYLLKM